MISDASADAWAIAGVLLAVVIVLTVFARSRSVAYLIPPAWGLIAVYVAEQAHRPLAAWLALGSAIALLALAIWKVLRRRA